MCRLRRIRWLENTVTGLPSRRCRVSSLAGMAGPPIIQLLMSATTCSRMAGGMIRSSRWRPMAWSTL
ncbi:hypothetical protein D3C81_2096590 [compost metagenome]